MKWLENKCAERIGFAWGVVGFGILLMIIIALM